MEQRKSGTAGRAQVSWFQPSHVCQTMASTNNDGILKTMQLLISQMPSTVLWKWFHVTQLKQKDHQYLLN